MDTQIVDNKLNSIIWSDGDVQQAPIIQVSHPNVPMGSQDSLLDDDDDFGSKKEGIDNPSLVLERPSPVSETPSDGRNASRQSINLDQLFDPTPRNRGNQKTVIDEEPSDELPALLSRQNIGRLRSPRSSIPSLPGYPAMDSLMVPPVISPLIYEKRRQSLTLNGTTDAIRTSPCYDLASTDAAAMGGLNVSQSPGLTSIGSWSENVTPWPTPLHRRRDKDALSSSNSISNVSSNLSERMRSLVRAFSSRTQRIKEKNAQPPTPSSESSLSGQSLVSMATLSSDKPTNRLRLDSLMGGGSVCPSCDKEEVWFGVGRCQFKIPACFQSVRLPASIQPQSKLYISWLFVVTMAFLYNACVIPLRGVFPYQTDSNLYYWMAVDYLCDVIYIVDIVLFKSRISFIEDGMTQTNKRVMFVHYRKKVMFKIQSFWEFFDRIDQAARSGHALRVVRTMTYMIFLIHLETCGYYAVSRYEGLNSNRWVYNGKGNAYIRCFYLATKTATSIGNNPKPTNILEYSFMTVYWLSGVFVFALLIGQIRNIFEAATQVETSYTKTRDIAIAYMKSINLPPEMQDRVRMWFDHNWRQQKTLDESSLYRSLPRKLQLDMAVNVHYETLSKVQLFQDCDKNLLYDLLLKLKAVLFLPGDYICRKGEVGKEMYIVSNGQVEVVGGPNNLIVFATLHAGSVFGEISLLALTGGNRRTADVRSKGFTNVFILSKKDFEAAMNDYPVAQKMLRKRAKKLLSENAARERETKTADDVEEIIKTPRETPKLLKTVLKVMNRDSETINRLSGAGYIPPAPNGRATQEPHATDNTKDDYTKDYSDDRRAGSCIYGSQFSLSDIVNDSDGESLTDCSLSPDCVFQQDFHARSVSQMMQADVDERLKSPDVAIKSTVSHNTSDSPSVSPESPRLRSQAEIRKTSELSSDFTSDFTSDCYTGLPKSTIKQRRVQGSGNSNKSVRFDNSPRSNKTVSNHVHCPPRADYDGIPAENKITCSVDVHREKSLTPSASRPDELTRPLTNSALSWLFSIDNTRETLC